MISMIINFAISKLNLGFGMKDTLAGATSPCKFDCSRIISTEDIQWQIFIIVTLFFCACVCIIYMYGFMSKLTLLACF